MDEEFGNEDGQEVERRSHPAGDVVIRRALVDALFAMNFDHEAWECRCEPCSGLREILERLGLRIDSWGSWFFPRFVSVADEDADAPISDTALSILVKEIRDFREGVVALGGALEVPEPIANLLWKDGWGPLLLKARDEWKGGRKFDEQDSLIQSIRRGFIDELARVAIPDGSVPATDLVDRLEAQRIEGLEEADRVLDDHRGRFRGWGFICPEIPSQVAPYVRFDGSEVGIITEGVPIESIAGYGLELDERHPNVPVDYLAESMPDFFVAGGHGNGYSSFWGLATRGGGLFASLQLTIWRLSMGGDETDGEAGLKRRVNAAMTAYNGLLVPLLNRGRRPVICGVVFSDYRQDAYVVCDRYRLAEERNSSLQLPPRWSCILDLGEKFDNPDFDVDRELAEARRWTRDVPEVEAAIDFLEAVVKFAD